MKLGTYESRFYMAYSSFREQKLARLMRQCARGVIRGVLVFCSLGIPHMEVGTCDANTCQLAGLLRGRTETFAEVGLHLVPPSKMSYQLIFLGETYKEGGPKKEGPIIVINCQIYDSKALTRRWPKSISAS
jgi:hypothetical protein